MERMISFLDRCYSLPEWNNIQSSMNDRLCNGSWIDSYQVDKFEPLYSKPCFFEHPAILKYIEEDCKVSNPNVGNYYTWKPHRDDFVPWDPSQMCHMANGRNIMFVGDSLQQEFYFAFVSAQLAVTAIRGQTPLSSSLLKAKCAQNHFICDKLCEWNENCERLLTIDCGDKAPPYSTIFGRTNFLDGYDNTATSKDTNHWLQMVKTYNISLLFLNTGAHHQPDESLIRNINSSLKHLYDNYPTVSIIYRNTQHGHDHCEDTMNALPLDHTLYKHSLHKHSHGDDGISEAHPEYGWQNFNHQNAMVQLFLQEMYPQVFYLDVASSTNLRADSHVSAKDCYHYCIPGPVDEWIIYHFNALLQLTKYQQKLHPQIQYTTTLPNADCLISQLNLINGDIIKAISHPAHYLYENGFKRYINIKDMEIFFSILNTTEEHVKIMSDLNLGLVPTKKWSS